MKVLTWRRVLEENDHALVAIRHGETEYNLEDRCATSTDVPLTKAGRIAALEAAGSLVASPSTESSARRCHGPG